jgi:hypothetical protein
MYRFQIFTIFETNIISLEYYSFESLQNHFLQFLILFQNCLKV